MSKKEYPLEQLAKIKQKRLEEAEKVLKEKKAKLEEEQKTLLDVEKKRDEVKTHRDEKLNQMTAEMNQGTTSDKIESMLLYLQVVEEKLVSREQKVKAQAEKVKQAQTAVEAAKKEVLKKQVDIEKISTHKTEWTKEITKEEERQMNIEGDELGSAMFVRRKPKRRS